eukprot:147884-Chlamydomonas_euryale.AAC.1
MCAFEIPPAAVEIRLCGRLCLVLLVLNGDYVEVWSSPEPPLSTSAASLRRTGTRCNAIPTCLAANSSSGEVLAWQNELAASPANACTILPHTPT